jgi:extracellular elastinolytic metalloproteinase
MIELGSVWAEVLHIVYAALVKKYGWDKTARTNPASVAGNAVFLHLFMDSLPLLPCNPTGTCLVFPVFCPS